MITYIVMTAIYAVVWTIARPIALLPDATLPGNVATYLAQVAGYIAPVASYVPLGDVIAITVLVVGIEGGYFTWKLINWVRKLLPGQS
jgi:hypothetical protein